MNRFGLPLVLAFALATAGPACSSSKETPAMTKKPPPSASRPAPPQVSPVEYQGVRYQQDNDALRHGADHASGYLVAIDPTTGTRLWMLKVYAVPAPTAQGLPSFGRYFRRMKLLDQTEQLEIENEVGGIYRVDLRARTSTWISGPDSKP